LYYTLHAQLNRTTSQQPRSETPLPIISPSWNGKFFLLTYPNYVLISTCPVIQTKA